MAHEIELNTKTGKHRMFALDGISVWHEGSTNITRLKQVPATVQELLDAADLDWEVEGRPLFRKLPDGAFAEIDDAQAIVRKTDDQFLGSTGASFTPVQNRELAEIAFAMGAGGVEIVTAGAILGGSQVWMLAKYPELFTWAGEKHEAFLCLSNGHNGTRSLTITPTAVTVVCANTLAMSDRSTKAVRLNHTEGVGNRVKQVIAEIKQMKAEFAQTGERFDRLAGQRISATTRDEFFGKVAARHGGSEESQAKFFDALGERWSNGRGQGDRGQTAWRAFSSVTDAVDHLVRPHEVIRPSARKAQAHMIDSLVGAGSRLKRFAFSEALTLTGIATN